MSDTRVPAAHPVHLSADEADQLNDGIADESSDTIPTATGGFLIDDTDDAVEHAVSPTPSAAPPRPSVSATSPLQPGNQPADPASTALVLRIFGGLLLVFAIVVARDAADARGLIAPAVLLIAGLALVFYFASVERLRRDHIIDRWDMLMDGATGRGDLILDGTVARIEQQELPQIQHAVRNLAASLLRGGTRPFLIVTHVGNRRLAPYQMHVNVRNYGTSLQTSWYLSYHRGFFEKFVPNPLVALDLFDEQDLRAYVSVVHHCFMDAVTELMLSLGQDASKLERNSRGFLGIS